MVLQYSLSSASRGGLGTKAVFPIFGARESSQVDVACRFHIDTLLPPVYISVTSFMKVDILWLRALATCIVAYPRILFWFRCAISVADP